MDILKSKTVTMSDGNVSVSTGLNLAQIIKVARQGIQHDYVGLIGINSANRAWTFTTWNRRIVFNTSFPSVGNEKIFIIYKETT
jgi:hypothetical protein